MGAIFKSCVGFRKFVFFDAIFHVAYAKIYDGLKKLVKNCANLLSERNKNTSCLDRMWCRKSTNIKQRIRRRPYRAKDTNIRFFRTTMGWCRIKKALSSQVEGTKSTKLHLVDFVPFACEDEEAGVTEKEYQSALYA